eukprot:TRINITY_DN15777_c0_g1_i2.p1 TRINITY_DN15777_c0_g1~~TRINITY_DN15777_c0_g1_i2.p1  ORF type:complete len:385 (-),score=69.84 TRINITY_DN15777_c0_g1_i2:294-1448(-)
MFALLLAALQFVHHIPLGSCTSKDTCARVSQQGQQNPPSLVAADIDSKSRDVVVLRWDDGMTRSFHALWLLDNSPSRRDPVTRQKLQLPSDMPADAAVAAVDVDVQAEALHVTWAPPDQNATFDSAWLRGFGFDSRSSEKSWYDFDASSRLSSAVAPTVRRFQYAAVSADDEARFDWLSALAADGAAILEQVPEYVNETEGVRAVANLIGPVQATIYGESFEVVSKGAEAINIAYTKEYLAPHMDLVYYESPPGLQFLQCLRLDDDVVGGESTLVDAFAVAEELRRSHPDAFETLKQVPATFLKDHSRREKPVLLSYQRPHLAVDPRTERLTGVFWAPPFEGPLKGVSTEAAGKYRHLTIGACCTAGPPSLVAQMAPDTCVGRM